MWGYRQKAIEEINGSKSEVLVFVGIAALFFLKKRQFSSSEIGMDFGNGFFQEGLIFGEIQCRHA